ncbi:MAG: IS1595 family transposase, partial [Verrucomicrobia bacterium]|nr:IS1595 family transposase [Verrucomicrobiota bacterium]
MEKSGYRRPESCRKTGPKNSTQISRHHVECPQCGARQSCQPADGRRRCKACRRWFAPQARKARLKAKTVKEIARLFWLMVPAERVARDLGLNRKTVQRYYTRLREALAAESERSLEQLCGEIEIDESYFGGVRKGERGRGAGGKIPVFGLLKRAGEVRVAFPERLEKPTLQGAIKTHVKPQSWVYSDSFRAYDRLDVEGFHHVRIAHESTFGSGKAHINGIDNFWGFAKRGLKMYHGGFKRNFPLFTREMEFRFNHRDDPDAVTYLYKLLKS